MNDCFGENDYSKQIKDISKIKLTFFNETLYLANIEKIIHMIGASIIRIELVSKNKVVINLETFLHPVIYQHAYPLFLNKHFSQAVLTAITAVFDLIRERTNIDFDGEGLITQVFSENEPKLIVSDIKTVSGRNDQIGFMNILQGVYKGVRNPKAHSLRHDLTEEKTIEYLIFASLLARTVSEAKRVRPKKTANNIR